VAENWTVTNQRQTRAMLDGVFQDAMEVTFKTGDNHIGSVLVPASKYTPDNVRQAIDARVAQITAINQL
jgi:hypothetical protein